MREDVFREIESLPTAHSWPDASEGERERREKILRGIVQRIVEDGPRKAVASPERGRQFIPFAALRGYDEMIEGQNVTPPTPKGPTSQPQRRKTHLRCRIDARRPVLYGIPSGTRVRAPYSRRRKDFRSRCVRKSLSCAISRRRTSSHRCGGEKRTSGAELTPGGPFRTESRRGPAFGRHGVIFSPEGAS